MRLRHFEALRPLCPVCRPSGDSGFALEIAHVAREAGGHIVEAILHCSNPRCLREYPVIDGIPLLIGNLRQYIADNALRLLARQDLSPMMESVIGDCCGPGSDFDTVRQQVSAYAWEHYGDFDPDEVDREPRPGTMLAALASGCELAAPSPAGPVLEVGCGTGRGSFALAERLDELVLGVDLHLPMLRLAGRVLRDGTVSYARRRVGLVYDRREFQVRFARSDNVDFWACDATALPFPPATFSMAVALNVLDCIYAPRELLSSLAGVLVQGGKAVLSSPYDWSPGATPIESWLGGHSQRSTSGGASEHVVRELLTPGGSTEGVKGLRISAERDDLPWNVRLHERSTMTYRLHQLVVERHGEASA